MADSHRLGTLTIKPICAKLTHNTELFGKMDPYCVIKLGGQAQKTAVIQNAGKYPTWTDKLIFRKTTETEISIKVWDRDIAKSDDLIGEATQPIEKFIGPNLGFDGWIDLKYKQKGAGQIKIHSEFIPEEQTIPSHCVYVTDHKTSKQKNEAKEQKSNQDGSGMAGKISGQSNATQIKPTAGIYVIGPVRKHFQPVKLVSNRKQLAEIQTTSHTETSQQPKKSMNTLSKSEEIQCDPKEHNEYPKSNPRLTAQRSLDLQITPNLSKTSIRADSPKHLSHKSPSKYQKNRYPSPPIYSNPSNQHPSAPINAQLPIFHQPNPYYVNNSPGVPQNIHQDSTEYPVLSPSYNPYPTASDLGHSFPPTYPANIIHSRFQYPYQYPNKDYNPNYY